MKVQKNLESFYILATCWEPAIDRPLAKKQFNQKYCKLGPFYLAKNLCIC
jgi:hypothetical protein